jgi:hypothetical protein
LLDGLQVSDARLSFPAMIREPHSDWPIIVGGCHRSGTSLVRRILDSHSRIHCGPEVKFFSDLYGDRVPDPFRMLRFIPTAQTLLEGDELLEVLGMSFVELHRRAARAVGKTRWADKAPENLIYCPQWQRLLGDEWLLVHVLRNPLDTIASIGEIRFVDVPVTISARIGHYRSYVEAGLRFGANHPERYLPVIYEQLAGEPRETVVGLMTSLGEAFEPRQLTFNDQAHQYGVEDPKVAVTTAVHGDSLHRWGDLLAPEEAELIWEMTAGLWTRIDPDRRFVEVPLSFQS